MTAASATLLRLRRLLERSGDPTSAFRALHAYLAATLPRCSLALVLLPADNAPRDRAVRVAGLIDADGVEHVAAGDPLALSAELPALVDTAGAALLRSGEPLQLSLATLPRTPASLLSPASALALPMLTADGIRHWLVLGSDDAGRFAGVDIDALLRDATLAYSALARPLVERALEDDARRHHRAIEGLADIQRLLQPEPRGIRGLEYAVSWQPAETAAGDYYDLMPLGHVIEGFIDTGADAWGALLGDVSGHGAAAAMEAVQFDAILRTYDGSEPPGGPGGALTYANRHFFSRRQRPHFMTLFSAAHRPDRGTLDYVCAGHQPALLRRGDEILLLGRDADAGIPLGVLREHRWDNVSVPFGAGDVLVLYTDGVTEARDRGGVMFGAERLQQLVREGDPGAHATLERVRRALHAHQGSETGSDDQTVIVLQQLS